MSSQAFPVDSHDATFEAGPGPDRPNFELRQPPVYGVYNPALLKLYDDLPSSPEVLLDDNELPGSFNWGDNLTGYTGAAYLAGATAGVFSGLRRAIVQAERGESAKLRLNRVLNNCGAVGRTYGNRAGIIAMLFVATKHGVRTYRSGADDWVNTAAAGISTGALFRMPGGPRASVVGGVVGGLLAGAALVAGKTPVFRR